MNSNSVWAVMPFNESFSFKAPVRATFNSACYDICYSGEAINLHPGKVTLVPTNLKFECRDYYKNSCVEILSRSGLAKNGIFVANAPGIVDADYKGEVGVLLYNSTNSIFRINDGDRIAQCRIVGLDNHVMIGSICLNQERGEGGFGSTGFSTTASGGPTAVVDYGTKQMAFPFSEQIIMDREMHEGTSTT